VGLSCDKNLWHDLWRVLWHVLWNNRAASIFRLMEQSMSPISAQEFQPLACSSVTPARLPGSGQTSNLSHLSSLLSWALTASLVTDANAQDMRQVNNTCHCQQARSDGFAVGLPVGILLGAICSIPFYVAIHKFMTEKTPIPVTAEARQHLPQLSTEIVSADELPGPSLTNVAAIAKPAQTLPTIVENDDMSEPLLPNNHEQPLFSSMV